MKNLLAAAHREEIENRIQSLSAESQRQWGSLSVSKAVCHLGDQLAMALGEIDCQPRGGPMSWAPFKQLAIFLMPWPKGVDTAPALLKTDLGELEEARQRLFHLIDRFVRYAEEKQEFAVHPMFGRLGRRTWGRLAYRHLDHHLRQFSV